MNSETRVFSSERDFNWIGDILDAFPIKLDSLILLLFFQTDMFHFFPNKDM